MALIDNLEGLVLGYPRGGTVDRGTPAPDVTRTPGPIQQQTEDTRPTLPSGFIRKILDMRDAVPHTTRLGKPGYIHASSLPGLCPRQHVLMTHLGMRTEERITGAHRVMWTVGRSVEQHIRDQLIEGYPSAAFGMWSCLCGAVQHRGHKPADLHCGGCSTPATTYNELTLTDEENGVTGNPDIVLRHEGKYLPVEIKSMTGDDWEALKSPKGNHLAQVLSYHRLLSQTGLPMHDDVAIIYCTKHFKWGSPYKEFHTKATAEQNVKALDHLFGKAREVKEASYANLPPREVCAKKTSPRAKKCPVAAICFERNGGCRENA